MFQEKRWSSYSWYVLFFFFFFLNKENLSSLSSGIIHRNLSLPSSNCGYQFCGHFSMNLSCRVSINFYLYFINNFLDNLDPMWTMLDEPLIDLSLFLINFFSLVSRILGNDPHRSRFGSLLLLRSDGAKSAEDIRA